MILGILFAVLSILLGFAFVISLFVLLFKLVKKTGLKKTLITASCLFVSSVVFAVVAGLCLVKAVTDGSMAKNITEVVNKNFETVKASWSAQMLKKADYLTLQVDKIIKPKSETSIFDSEVITKKYADTYEFSVIVDNAAPSEVKISYKELRKSNLIYVKDENDIIIPAYVINHAEYDDVPWLFQFLLPSYKKEQKQEFIPYGKSYMNIRVDVPMNHEVTKVCIGNTCFDVDMKNVLDYSSEAENTETDSKSEE